MNKHLRAIVFLAALAILTAAVVAGTLSEYITKENKKDSATVTKFGVVLRISDESAFETKYNSPDGSEVTVASTAETVAPGTNDNGGVLITITGTPDVKTVTRFKLKVNSDIFLKTGTDAYYYPLVFTFSQVGDASGDITPVVLKTGTLREVADWLENEFPNTDAAENEPGTNLKSTYRLSWTWVFEESEQIDEYDTALGDLAAGADSDGLVSGVDYSVTVKYALTVTVAQSN